MPRRFKRFAMVRRAPVLPDDRGRNRFARRPVPDQCRLALIGDPDRSHFVRPAKLGDHRAANL